MSYHSYSIYFIKAACWVLQKRANDLKTSVVFLSIYKIRHYVQQECHGDLMSLCTTGDYGHLWIKLLLSSEMKSYVS